MRRTAAVALAVSALLLFIRTEGVGADFSDLVFSGADAHYRGDLPAAAAAFEAALRLAPGNGFARNQLGLVYAKQHEFDRAMEQFRQVAAMESDNTFARLWIGILYLQKGDLDLAYERFAQVVAIDENNADACYFLGTIHYVRRNLPEAIRYLKRARDADSQEPETHYRLARAFDNVDMLDNARLEYLRTLALKPTHTGALNDLGWLQYNRGRVQEAVSLWRSTLRINPRDRDAILNLAQVYNEQAFAAATAGDMAAAGSLWEKVLTVHPGDKAAKYYLQRYGKNGKGLHLAPRAE
jgi:tetratricopeptide (TPR) repeat protein